jgi:hypothetical protein
LLPNFLTEKVNKTIKEKETGASPNPSEGGEHRYK